MLIGYDYITRASDLDLVIRAVVEANVIGLDIETVGSVHDPAGYIRLVQIATGKKTYVVDLLHVGKEPARKLFQAICDPSIIKIGQNLKFEQQWIWRDYREEIWPLFDTWRASVLIDNGKQGLPHDLYAVYERYLGIAPPTEDLGGSNWSEPVLTEAQKAYAASDVIYLHQLRERIKPILAKKGLNQVALIEFGVVFPEACVELKGFPIDSQMWLALEAENAAKAEELRKFLLRELPDPKQQMTFFGMEPDFNLNSTQQMLASLKKLGVNVEDTKEMTLAMHAADFPLIDKLLDYRGYVQSTKTFGSGYLEHLCTHCGRFHPRYFPFTGAGRYSCNHPNAQNVPRDPRFRACFRPGKGRTFSIRDWSNVEMRFIAEVSGDKKLIEIFNDPNGDVHRSTAAIITGKSESEVVKKERQDAKAINFGYSFGMMPPKFVLYARANYGVVISLKDARANRDKFFELYSGVADWHEKCFNQKHKITRTIAGRLRYLPEDAHSELTNSPIQGAAADALKKALRRVHKDLLAQFSWDDTWLTHHVHDEIIVESDDDKEKLEEIDRIMEKGMNEELQSFLTKVPAASEGGSATSWAEK